MKILILGGDGMLGHKAVQALRERHSVTATFRAKDGAGHRPAFAGVPESCIHSGVDACDFESVERVLDQVRPVAVLNCIGIVKQREAANGPVPALRVNALFPHLLAEACGKRNARLVHLSTDCVFSGRRGGYGEDDEPDPVDLYGRTKLLGEVDRPGCLTLRTSMIGWEIKNFHGLVEWLAAQRGRTIKGFRRAIFTGLTTTELVILIERLLTQHPALTGVWHAASSPISKYELLASLRDMLKWTDITILPDDQFQCDRSLLGTRLTQETGWKAKSWEEMLAGLAREWPAYECWRTMSHE